MKPAGSDNWVVLRRRVSLAGRVTIPGGNAASGGAVTLTAKTATARFETRVLADGFYFFVDLPHGDYLLTGRDEYGNEATPQTITLPLTPGTARPPVVKADVVTVSQPASTVDERPRKRAQAKPGGSPVLKAG